MESVIGNHYVLKSLRYRLDSTYMVVAGLIEQLRRQVIPIFYDVY